jgi:hypothetical protein
MAMPRIALFDNGVWQTALFQAPASASPARA